MAKNKPPQTPPITDPLEASKIALPPEPPAPAPTAPPPELAVVAPEAVEPPRPKVKRYRVVETTTISLFGSITRLNKDDIVSEASYGPDGMRRIVESNVALMEVE